MLEYALRLSLTRDTRRVTSDQPYFMIMSDCLLYRGSERKRNINMHRRLEEMNDKKREFEEAEKQMNPDLAIAQIRSDSSKEGQDEIDSYLLRFERLAELHGWQKKDYHVYLGSSLRVYCTVLYSTLLYSTLLYSTLLYSTLLYSTLLYSTLLYSTLLYYTILYYTILYYTILYYTIL
ncbi:hypothetical protein Hamer_G027027, partial [Homarus americanus]